METNTSASDYKIPNPRQETKKNISLASDIEDGEAPSFLGDVHYKTFLFRTVAVYPDLVGVTDAVTLLNKAGFVSDQISLLGREQENWQEQLSPDWKMKHTAKGAAEGAALGLIPGAILATGVVLSGGVGVLAAGPIAAILAALGGGALAGGLMGGGVSNLDGMKEQPENTSKEIEDALGRGQWVVIVHCRDEAEATNAQSLLPDSRIGREPHRSAES